MVRRALLVGIDAYPQAPLSGCVSDVRRLGDLLATNHDGSPNFECRHLVSEDTEVKRSKLREAIEVLLRSPADVALFFFAGHGTHNNLGGHLVTQDAEQYDDGVSMTDLLGLAGHSPVQQVVIILDCCHSGAFGAVPSVNSANDTAVIRHGLSVLTASRAAESSAEDVTGGVFTSLVCDALAGGAADVCGKVTTAGIYSYVDEALGAWEQRPLYKAHVSSLCSLRRAAPAVSLDVLRLLPKYFTSPTHEKALDPSYEPTCEPRHPEHELALRHLQKYRNAGLVLPVGAEHLYDAAVQSCACRLTALGRHYWELANSGKL